MDLPQYDQAAVYTELRLRIGSPFLSWREWRHIHAPPK